jgi:hypothetical protein
LFDGPIDCFQGLCEVKPLRAPVWGILTRITELSIVMSSPSVKLRRAFLATYPRLSGWLILAKESQTNGLIAKEEGLVL